MIELQEVEGGPAMDEGETHMGEAEDVAMGAMIITGAVVKAKLYIYHNQQSLQQSVLVPNGCNPFIGSSA